MNLDEKQHTVSEEEKNTIHELFVIICLYFISKKINFTVKNSVSSESKYISIKGLKQRIRISNHWQEDSKDIQVITIYDLAKVYFTI